MSAADLTAVTATTAQQERQIPWRAIFSAICVVVPVALWFAPLGIPHPAQGAMAISTFMILAWMTNIMRYRADSLTGCLLFSALAMASSQRGFSCLANDPPWFLFAAVVLRTPASKTGLPQRIASSAVSHVATSYSRLLLGLIVT